MIIISIIIAALYSTVLKRKFQTTAFSTTILTCYAKSSEFTRFELDVKDTLFEI